MLRTKAVLVVYGYVHEPKVISVAVVECGIYLDLIGGLQLFGGGDQLPSECCWEYVFWLLASFQCLGSSYVGAVLEGQYYILMGWSLRVVVGSSEGVDSLVCKWCLITGRVYGCTRSVWRNWKWVRGLSEHVNWLLVKRVQPGLNDMTGLI